MSAYLTPGIYRRVPPAPRRDLARVRTDIAGFVGYAERGPLAIGMAASERDVRRLAVRLTSWKGYQTVFGGFTSRGFLPYAVRAFFANGGTTCYVTRIAATRHADPWQRPRATEYALPHGDVAAQLIGQLTSAAEVGEFELELDTTAGLEHGELITLSGSGRTLHAMIEAVLDGQRLRLAGALREALVPGMEVERHATALRVRAMSAGSWGQRIRLSFRPLELGEAVSEFSLRVRVARGEDLERPLEEEFYKRLSLDPASDLYAPEVINTLSSLIEVDAEGGASLRFGSGPLRSGAVHLEGGRDGLSGVELEDFTGGVDDLRGLRLLEAVDEVAILCCPDAVFERAQPPVLLPPLPDPCAPPIPPQEVEATSDDPTAVPPTLDVQRTALIFQAMLGQCERLIDRVSILDPFFDQNISEVVSWRNVFRSRFGAIYYPWLMVSDPVTEPSGSPLAVPPSAHVAGLYARIDNSIGVQQPPANAALEDVVDVAEEIDHQQQERLNPEGVNAIRAFPGRGVRVWGARSIAGRSDADWRFIHVRRVMSMIEESVDEATQWAVFENHNEALRSTLVHSLTVFLEALWLQGGLKGNRPEEAFYVKCDENNNPETVIDAGQLICEIGIAVAAPMEFLVFEMHRGAAGAGIVER